MQTIYDWVTIALFAGIIVLFLQRSTSDVDQDAEKHNSLAFYLIAAGSCAVVNYVGNHGNDVIAIILLVATLAFIWYFLRPFKWRR